jgi:hypothetical protein
MNYYEPERQATPCQLEELQQPEFCIFIQSLTGRRVAIDAYRLETIGFIKNKIQCKKLVSMSRLEFKFQGMYLPSEILPELRGALALFILKATDI